MDYIYDTLREIAATSSRKEKEALLSAAMADEAFAKVCLYAYDPFRTYGIDNLPEPIVDDRPNTCAYDFWNTLDALATRAITGDAARYDVDESIRTLDAKTAWLLWAIIKKDLRAGFGASTLNKVRPGMIAEFPYMRCSLPKEAKLDAFDWSVGVFSQEKADGMFVNVNFENDIVQFTSRQGSPFPMEPFTELTCLIRRHFEVDTQTHGELLVEKAGSVLPREQSNGVLNSILSGGVFADDERPILLVWDQIPIDAVKPKGQYTQPYAERYGNLVFQLSNLDDSDPIQSIPTRVVHTLADAYRDYAGYLALGKEGTVIKDPSAIWFDGTSKQQVKLKLEVDVDLEITGFNPGEGKYAATFGSIVTRTACGQLEVSVSGFKDAVRKQIHDQRDALIGTVITVRANSIMVPANDGDLHSLFLPRFVELRHDKTQADDLQRVRDQFEAAIQAVAA